MKKYKIAFFHNKLGKTDGVSLEVDKWRQVLEKMGHKVYYCAGNNDDKRVYCVPELHFEHPKSYKILKNATVKFSDYKNTKVLEDEIYQLAETIKEKILTFIRKNRIEILIPNNLVSVAYHLPALIAMSEVIKETGLPTICHNHDFYYEIPDEIMPTFPKAKEILERYVPPNFPNVTNLVINKLAQKKLNKKRGIKANIVPNVFDFKQEPWLEDGYNKTFRKDAKIGENDLYFLQATRVLDRKGIEIAIDLIAELEKPKFRNLLYQKPLYNGKRFTKKDKIMLVCAGYIDEFGSSESYDKKLARKAKKLNVNIKFIENIVSHSRSRKNGKKVYSLWDSYTHADFVTYPSIWEGWGNQFIEAVFAKVPIVLREYPVFISDLKKDKFKFVSLGNRLEGRDKEGLAFIKKEKIQKTAFEIITLLQDPKKRKDAVENNFKIAARKYSYQKLEKMIEKFINKVVKK